MSHDAPAPTHLVILGLMGAGKTTVARELAARLGWPRLDNDEQVEAAVGSTAHEVATTAGLDRLHEIELAVLREALARPAPVVLTAAASVVDDPAVGALLGERACTVWLRARPETLAARVRRDPARPILAGDTDVLATLAEQAARRSPGLEALADLVVDVDDLTPAAVADRVVAGLVAHRADGRGAAPARRPGPSAAPPG